MGRKSISEILAELAKQQSLKNSKLGKRKIVRRKKKKKEADPTNILIIPILQASFTEKQKLEVIDKALYETDEKKKPMRWHMLLLITNPNIANLAKKIGIPRGQLEKEYRDERMRMDLV